MKYLDFNSPYARLGMFMALFALFLSNSFTFSYGHTTKTGTAEDFGLERGERVFRYNFGGHNPQYKDFVHFVEQPGEDTPKLRPEDVKRLLDHRIDATGTIIVERDFD